MRGHGTNARRSGKLWCRLELRFLVGHFISANLHACLAIKYQSVVASGLLQLQLGFHVAQQLSDFRELLHNCSIGRSHNTLHPQKPAAAMNGGLQPHERRLIAARSRRSEARQARREWDKAYAWILDTQARCTLSVHARVLDV